MSPSKKNQTPPPEGKIYLPLKGLDAQSWLPGPLIYIYISFLSGCFFSGLYLLVPRFQMVPQADSFPEVGQAEVS